MSPLPRRMVDRWRNRQELGPGQGRLYWHILLRDQPEVRNVAQTAQARLARFPGLHMTPARWLHITVLVAGTADEITDDQQRDMLAAASKLLAKISPSIVGIGNVLYHREAIALSVHPTEFLDQLREAVQIATLEATGTEYRTEEPTQWFPHVTIAYSETEQPAEPLIAALGRQLPSCETSINAVSLVIQRGAERLWDWHPVGDALLYGHR